ncbi:MAG: N-acetyl-gamma-glutamyl-phosphate reductase [Desulfovibrionaceae bacterium]|jgi:N-acetyl-gamma-glutamyl-phosphate reductase|nr:N-acetyl-gamma-glutamyl-phosphate reductase [Desulfovibrionaceae bacterium]
MAQVNAGLVGVTGYTGMELTRLLAAHSCMRLVRATSRAEAGKPLESLYPFLQGFEMGALTLTEPDVADLAAACDVVFLAVPHGVAMDMAGRLFDAGVKVVDLSADLRIRDRATYEQWYKVEHTRPDLLDKAVFGLPELYRDAVASAALVANPGCYPTSAILGLYPALAGGLVDPEDIVIDAKSGATGAGRKAAVGTLFCEVADSFKAYNIGGRHRHTPEIEQELSRIAGRSLTVSFNPHLLPINRGILSTIYTRLAPGAGEADVRRAYEEAYAAERWVRVLPAGRLPELRYVRGTMFCDIGLTVDVRTGRLIVTSAIDNLCRGASGQALANANIMLGLDEADGLAAAPLMP